MHGKGVFALVNIPKHEVIIEYKGELITWQQAQDRHPHNPLEPNHTFYFHINEDHVIDGGVKGNSARWINHSCNPNCEADEIGEHVFIKAIKNIKAGDELNYDYGLMIDERYTLSSRPNTLVGVAQKNAEALYWPPNVQKNKPLSPKTQPFFLCPV